jgi:aryl-alcohol dehydrogenase-like predicted oxidoreductase
MNYTALGRTGLRVSRMGLGCGGHSRLGLARGGSAEHAERIVKDAISLGINFIDTAESYGTESAVGNALVGVPRESYILSTKAGINAGFAKDDARSQPDEFASRVEASLKKLRTDHIDVFHLHGVQAADYSYARDEVYPELVILKDQGKIRHIGITEAFAADPSHQMLAPAVQNDPDLWDVVMVGFNLLNPSARKTVLPVTMENGIGTLCMFAVRRALSQPESLRELVGKLISDGAISAGDVSAEDPLGFLLADSDASSIPEAAYRFCLHEPGMDVILSGTGNPEHLRQNAKFLSMPPLPTPVQEKLRDIFEHVDSVSGN